MRQKLFSYCILLLAIVQNENYCNAQIENFDSIYDFLPRERVIFEDDFRQDGIGQFPSRWRLSNCNEKVNYQNKQYCKVRKVGDDFVFVVPALKWPIYFEPDLADAEYLCDSLTIEFDFLKDDPFAVCAITFPFQNEILFSGRTNGMGIGLQKGTSDSNFKVDIKYETPRPQSVNINGIYPGEFDEKEWHHFAFSVYKNEIKGYLDQYRLVKFDGNTFHPKNFVLQLQGPIKIKNFRITTGREVNMFNKIITDKKVVTNAIHFDVGKWEIRTESGVVIMQLAQFLKTNASVKLEIGGHTDNDGDAAANIRLSQARADEVKKQLVALGISTARLTTKGYGTTKPIAENATWQGKAKNRRVEFVKL